MARDETAKELFMKEINLREMRDNKQSIALLY